MLFERGASSPIYLYRTLSYSGQRKIHGFCHSAENHGITDAEHRTFSCPGSVEKTCQILENVCRSGLFFDAVAAADDELAVGAVKYAFKKGLHIPEDFQIAGYNNSVLSTCSTPEITTLDNKVEFLCTSAVNQMIQILNGKDIPPQMIYSGSIVEHETTGKIMTK